MVNTFNHTFFMLLVLSVSPTPPPPPCPEAQSTLFIFIPCLVSVGNEFENWYVNWERRRDRTGGWGGAASKCEWVNSERHKHLYSRKVSTQLRDWSTHCVHFPHYTQSWTCPRTMSSMHQLPGNNWGSWQRTGRNPKQLNASCANAIAVV